MPPIHTPAHLRRPANSSQPVTKAVFKQPRDLIPKSHLNRLTLLEGKLKEAKQSEVIMDGEFQLVDKEHELEVQRDKLLDMDSILQIRKEEVERLRELRKIKEEEEKHRRLVRGKQKAKELAGMKRKRAELDDYPFKKEPVEVVDLSGE